MVKNIPNRNKLIIPIIIGVIILSFIIISSIMAVTGRATTTTPQCNDKKDNDGDKKCDYAGCTIKRVMLPMDPDCINAQDNSEACTPTAEICDNKDNDCDQQIDEGLAQQCGVTDVGECQYGSKTCSAGVWGNCNGNIDPAAEICDTKDNNCNGLVDEGCNCTNGIIQTCGTDVGECQAGTQTCVNGNWESCIGEILPITEICDTKDNDCDGSIDEGCNCVDGQIKSCGTDVGECTAGTQTCAGGNWGACIGSVGPVAEICDTKDNDCDGSVDEGVCNSDSCFDTDGGLAINLKGNVSGYKNQVFYSYTDFCLGNTTVSEYYCNGVAVSNMSLTCIANATNRCSNGACI